MELTRCPQCGLAAEILSRDVWESTEGPVEHAHVRCIDRHRFLLPVAMLAAVAPLHGAGASLAPAVAGIPPPRAMNAPRNDGIADEALAAFVARFVPRAWSKSRG